MPWSKKTVRTAYGIESGSIKPKGKLKGFSKDFAEQVIAEGAKKGARGTRSSFKKHKR